MLPSIRHAAATRALSTKTAKLASLATRPTLLNALHCRSLFTPPGLDPLISDMRDALYLNTTPEERWARRSKAKIANVADLKPNTYVGRSVPVVDGDFAHARTQLSKILAKNRVLQTFRRQKHHEKKGYKRRRLRSERWRRRFAHEVRMKIRLVNEIRARSKS